MSEFNLSSVNLNVESTTFENNNDKKTPQPEIIEVSNENQVNIIEVDDEYYKKLEEYHKEHDGIHFTSKKNIIDYHKDVNTNIIIKEHKEKLVFFCNFIYNFETSELMTDSTEEFEEYQEECVEDSCYFIARRIYSDDKKIIVEGTIGYSYDPRDLKLIYNLEENIIYIASYYRLLHHPSDANLFFDKYEMTNGKVVIDVEEKEGELVTITNNECELLTKDYDGIPYYRYPRSKDGIAIPRVVYNVFKVFQDSDAIHPKIIIPSEWNTYQDIKYTTISKDK